MPTLAELKEQKEYYVGMQCNLRQKKSEIERKIYEYGELEKMVDAQIQRREGEEDGDTV